MAKKRLIKAAVMTLLLLLFVSCKSAEPPAPKIDEGFTCKLTANYNGEEYAASLTKTALSVYEIALLSPAELKGMKLRYQGGQVTVEYLGLSHTVSSGDIPENAFFSAITGCLDLSVSSESLTYTGTKESLHLFTETYNGDKFDLFYDFGNKRVAKINIDALALSVAFEY